ncbi:MAG: hypothetical protein GY702_10425, partial [Desulfobulbaceae bacterium]|nr:hypothetical protein [Desulfobulbaceae bacterium]
LFSTSAYEKLSSGQTRFCFDPWVILNIKANGNLYPCCRSRFSFGTWKDHSIDEIIDSDAAIKFKIGLIEGGSKLHPDCECCPRKSPISIKEYTKKILNFGKIEQKDQTINSGFISFLKNHLPSITSKTD